MSQPRQFQRWLDTALSSSVRKRLTIGLLPSLMALLTLLGVGLRFLCHTVLAVDLSSPRQADTMIA